MCYSRPAETDDFLQEIANELESNEEVEVWFNNQAFSITKKKQPDTQAIQEWAKQFGNRITRIFIQRHTPSLTLCVQTPEEQPYDYDLNEKLCEFIRKNLGWNNIDDYTLAPNGNPKPEEIIYDNHRD